ncbi:hypothetical protein [Escherichia coli]|uniref:hypothetical protein n=1 Tax=Escherichia coli TaxID=562 RepID=UPI001432B43A|nr:hypothetical protein [Escherichia coli]NJZ74392.1 hypothetical protein [Escherichia coli]
MKKVLSTLFIALAASAATANAADKTANAVMTATVKEAAAIKATYTESAPLTEGASRNQKFGQIDVTGYKDGTLYSNIKLSDAEGTIRYLTFKSADGKAFQATAMNSGNTNYFAVNGSELGGIGQDVAFDGVIELRTSSNGTDLKAGKYSDVISLTVTNQ